MPSVNKENKHESTISFRFIGKAVGEFAKLPGIGRKTAMRLVLHLLRQDNATVEAFSSAISTLKKK